MLTQVHVGVALVGSAIIAPHDWRVAVLAGIGGFLPDFVVWIQLAYDIVRRRKPFAQCSRTFLRTYEIAHSMILMLPTFIVPPLAWGIYSHLIVDVVTHNAGTQYAAVPKDYFQNYLWPLRLRIPGIIDCESGKVPGWPQTLQNILAAALFVAFAVLEWR